MRVRYGRYLALVVTKESVEHVRVTHGRSRHERGPSSEVVHVDRCTMLDEQVARLGLALQRGCIQCSAPDSVLLIHSNPLRAQQRLESVEVAIVRSVVQRCSAKLVGSVDGGGWA